MVRQEFLADRRRGIISARPRRRNRFRPSHGVFGERSVAYTANGSKRQIDIVRTFFGPNLKIPRSGRREKSIYQWVVLVRCIPIFLTFHLTRLLGRCLMLDRGGINRFVESVFPMFSTIELR